ncbi:MAG: aminotransferase class I/II-fold pyridoxal phosphate-dependent enzyme [Actinobacteria bacterium]|nr:aminotransferase class I/II-fold pyridoxal phosphate-dependent enzyme [Actinomycetota bacterium]
MAPPFVDLRSDTVTRPTPEMRRAMAEAEVGDDLYGEDPTVNALQEAFADRVGKEAALYVPSGTMANQLVLRILARPGTAVVAGRRQHVVLYENGAAARNAGVQFHLVDDGDGTIDPEGVAWAVEAARHHQPEPSLVCVENTHMPANGIPWPLDRLRAVGEAAAVAGLPVHLDGARLFNAEVATGVSADRYAACATTVMCCLSKGLAAPVGSVLAGPAALMEEARRERAGLGGQMRQAGVIAAAGLVALRTMVERLVEDHDRARRLAEAVAERWPEAGCDPAGILTNCVTFTHSQPSALLDHLAGEGVLAGTIAPATVRLMTHHDVDDAGVERAMKALAASPA